MKNNMLCIILFASILAFNVSAQEHNLSREKQPTGFRGIKWGTNIQNQKNMILISDYNDGRKNYKRKSDKLSIGSASISEIVYVFYKDRFYQVLIGFVFPDRDSQIDHDILRDILVEAYGTPVVSSGMYIWANNNIEITLFPGGIIYTYMPIHKDFKDKYDKSYKRRIKKGVKDL